MVSRILPVNIPRVNWYDGQQVNEGDVTDEQNRNVGIDAATVNNFFGTGVLNENPISLTIFDSNNLNSSQQALYDSYSFDGSDLALGLPSVSDTTNGVQLNVTLTDVTLDGSDATYVSIIGDEFGGNLIHDDLTFNENGTQITRGRYKSIRSIIFSNFAGNLNGSAFLAVNTDGYNLTGRCVIQEAMAMEVSRDTVAASQVDEPNQYFTNFHTISPSITITEMLTDAIGSDKSFSELGISFTPKNRRGIVANDVTTRIGQKYLAGGNNIQKVTALLSVQYSAASALIPGNDGYEWSGSIVLTLHELQTDVQCPVSPVPDTAIDFDPDPTILAQITLDADDLAKQGVVLDGYARPVDFIFTGSKISDPLRSTIDKTKYYSLTIGRSGNADSGTILIEESTDRATNSHMIIYDGTQWIDVLSSDMWFVVQGDYVKVADGVAYDDGIGIQVLRIDEDSTGTQVPYVEGLLPFYTTTKDAYNYVLLDVTDEFTEPEQDQRTGNQVYSRVNPTPLISLENATNRTALLATEPNSIFLANTRDRNSRGNPAEITGTTCYPGLAYGNRFNILRPSADLIQNNLVGSILHPVSSGCSDCNFRIIKQTLYNDAYGDVNGNGTISQNDVDIVNNWLLSYGSIDISDAADQTLFTTGVIDVMQFFRADVNGDGIVNSTDANLIQGYVNGSVSTFSVGSTFPRMELLVEKITDPLIGAAADIPGTCCNSFDAPFSLTTCVPWKIEYFATWMPDLINVIDSRRLLSKSTDGDWFVAGDLIITDNILNPDGTPYSVDFEMNHLSLDFPLTDSYGNATVLDGYAGILLFDAFVAESSLGLTSSGFQAMKYSDGYYVQIGDFPTKVKITASIQSIVTEHTVVLGKTTEIIGLHYEPTTSMLTIGLQDLYNDAVLGATPSLSTKLLVSVYLKKAGFANTTRSITKSQMRTLLGI
jgi:hypothetical protein